MENDNLERMSDAYFEYRDRQERLRNNQHKQTDSVKMPHIKEHASKKTLIKWSEIWTVISAILVAAGSICVIIEFYLKYRK
jgi:UDP-N-acetylmuramyl pentapeptide phosphotransferase/UDP-N-acetylglucosamine-1-phosphate transferase